MVTQVRLEGLNAYDESTLQSLFSQAGLASEVTFSHQEPDPERPGSMDAWTAIVQLADPTLIVLAAWILKSRRKVTKIRRADGTVIEHRQESFIGASAETIFKLLQGTLGGKA